MIAQAIITTVVIGVPVGFIVLLLVLIHQKTTINELRQRVRLLEKGRP